MLNLVCFVLICFIAVSSYQIGHDEQGQIYYLVPVQSQPTLQRQKRDTNVAISDGRPGTRFTASHSGNIVNSNGHKLDGGAFASKQFRPSGPTTVGGQIGYSHVPSGSNFNVGAQHIPKFGTGVSATGTANIWSSGNHRLDAVGSYNRQFGAFGGHPNWYAGLEYKMKYHY